MVCTRVGPTSGSYSPRIRVAHCHNLTGNNDTLTNKYGSWTPGCNENKKEILMKGKFHGYPAGRPTRAKTKLSSNHAAASNFFICPLLCRTHTVHTRPVKTKYRCYYMLWPNINSADDCVDLASIHGRSQSLRLSSPIIWASPSMKPRK